MTDQPGCPCSICEERSLRDRIAAAIKSADKRVAGFITYEERADAVIRELGLTLEAGVIVGCLHD